MFRNENNKGANQSAPLLFANPKDRFFHIETDMVNVRFSFLK